MPPESKFTHELMHRIIVVLDKMEVNYNEYESYRPANDDTPCAIVFIFHSNYVGIKSALGLLFKEFRGDVTYL